MSSYNFYYDESEHSHKIRSSTVEAKGYYDNFLAVIVGWQTDKENDMYKKHNAFEEKYKDRNDNKNELKSQAIRTNRFKRGFQSLNQQNVDFVDDFFSLFDENCKLYFFIGSKIEYVITQLFSNVSSNAVFNVNAMRYTIIKAINCYKPSVVIDCAFSSSDSNELISVLKEFFMNRIEANKQNVKLKALENNAFADVIKALDWLANSVRKKYNEAWDYRMVFDGFSKYLDESDVLDYMLVLDEEGEVGSESATLCAAKDVGLRAIERDSRTSQGIRIADMMIGIVGKLLKSIHKAMQYKNDSHAIVKSMLDDKWFALDERQFQLYKKLHCIICEYDRAWYKLYSGLYSDDLVVFMSLLDYITSFDSVESLSRCSNHSEKFNAFVVERLRRNMRNNNLL